MKITITSIEVPEECKPFWMFELSDEYGSPLILTVDFWDKVRDWCTQMNIKRYTHCGNKLAFSHEQDAVLFALRWA
jgi:hypothetical protein